MAEKSREELLAGITSESLNKAGLKPLDQVEADRKAAEKAEKDRLAAEKRQRELEEKERRWAQRETAQRVRRSNVVAGVGVQPEDNVAGSRRTDWDPNKKTTSGT